MAYLILDHRSRLRAINKAVKALQKSNLKFDGIACTGYSGLLVAPTVAVKLKKPLALVRKLEPSHGEVVEWKEEVTSYVIIDDLVETGNTIKRIKCQMSKEFSKYDNKVECVGVYFYQQDPDGIYLRRFVKKFPDLWVEAST